MEIPKIVAMYRIKNGERWLKKSIESIVDVCSEIVVFDDCSSDKTVDICKEFKKVVEIEHQKNKSLDEVRDRNSLLKMALKRNPDYIFTIDADEILMPKTSEILLEEINVLYPNVNSFQFQFLTMYDKPNTYRYDGRSSNKWGTRILKMKNQPLDLKFIPTKYFGNVHCGGIPQNAVGYDNAIRSRVKFLHYSIFDSDLRKKKYQYYNEIDPNSKEQDGYRNIISDKSKFAGPKGIEIRTLSKGMFVEDIV